MFQNTLGLVQKGDAGLNDQLFEVPHVLGGSMVIDVLQEFPLQVSTHASQNTIDKSLLSHHATVAIAHRNAGGLYINTSQRFFSCTRDLLDIMCILSLLVKICVLREEAK